MTSGNSSGALEGVNVVDLMWVVAGPTTTRAMADFGATVVRIESSTRVDTSRTVQPFHDNEYGPEQSGLFINMNANKLGLTLDLKKPEAREVLLDLIDWGDILCESFSPKAMRSWGLDYETLRQRKPELIMFSTCLFGQDGPLSSVAGFGTMGSAISGFVALAGEAGGAPVGPFGAYTDYVAPRFSLATLLAALDHRERTGEGVYIDQAQAESALHFLTPALLEYHVNGTVPALAGNRDPQMAPHGVFRCSGDDAWAAIAVRDDDDWARFCEAIGQAPLAADARFATLDARKQNEDALEAIVSAWTAPRSDLETEMALQAAGVPAHAVNNSVACTADPQLQARDEFVTLPHPVHGTTVVEGAKSRLSRTPATYRTAGPTYGQHNDYVLRELLGYDDERIVDLTIAEALT